jgi:hypothetical protein
MQGYFIKHFIFCKAHPLPKEQRVFQYRTKSPGLNHPGISAVSHWFSFSKTATAQPPYLFKNHFSKAFLENKTLIVIPHPTHPFQRTRTIRIGLNSA